MIINTKIDQLKEIQKGDWDKSRKKECPSQQFLMQEICRED